MMEQFRLLDEYTAVAGHRAQQSTRVAAASGEEGEEMEDMNDILNPPAGNEETPADSREETATDEQLHEAREIDETPETGEENETTGVTTQVAAETTSADDAAKVKAELAALAKERERVRQKEAALDERLAAGERNGTEARETPEATVQTPQAELKDLRKQHRAALTETLLDPDDEEAAAKVEELEERMEELRLSLLTGAQRAASEQERMANDFNAVFKQVHEAFPFLAVDHPQVNAELNDDINSYYEGRLHKGDSPPVALRKAVDRFAPAYAAGLSSDNAAATAQAEEEKARKAEANRMIKDKLSRGGFSEVRSAGGSRTSKPFDGPTPLSSVLRKS